MKTCLLVMTHGSRTPEYGIEFNRLLDDIRSRGLYDDVRGCFLQFQQPSLADAAQAAAEHGFDHVIVVPYFLFSGFHIQKDIPEILGICRRNFPSVQFSITGPLGYDPVLSDLIIRRSSEARTLIGEE